MLHGTLPCLIPRSFHFQSHGILSTCIYVSSNVPSPEKFWQCLYPTVPSVLILMSLHWAVLKCFYVGNICLLFLTHPFPPLPPDILFSSLQPHCQSSSAFPSQFLAGDFSTHKGSGFLLTQQTLLTNAQAQGMAAVWTIASLPWSVTELTQTVSWSRNSQREVWAVPTESHSAESPAAPTGHHEEKGACLDSNQEIELQDVRSELGLHTKCALHQEKQ